MAISSVTLITRAVLYVQKGETFPLSCDKSCLNFKTDSCAVWRKDKSATLILSKSMLQCPHYEPKGSSAPAKVTFCDCPVCQEIRGSAAKPQVIVAIAPIIKEEQSSLITSDMPNTHITSVAKREEVGGRLKLTRIYGPTQSAKPVSTEISKALPTERQLPTSLPSRQPNSKSKYDTIKPQADMVSEKEAKSEYLCPKCHKPGMLEQHENLYKGKAYLYSQVRHGYDPRSKTYKRCYLGKELSSY